MTACSAENNSVAKASICSFPVFWVRGFAVERASGPGAQSLHWGRNRSPRTYARSSAAISRATSRARARSEGLREIAATLGWPPPPNFSASDARFFSAEPGFQGLEPMEILARVADALMPTEYREWGKSR